MSDKLDKFNIKIAREEYKYEKNSLECYFCKEMGHKTHTKGFVTCPKLKNKRCDICHQNGHASSHCMKK
jgi:hypothetical protein